VRHTPAAEHDPDLAAIRDAVTQVCAQFDDSYWAACEAVHRFPWDFYRAMAEGGWIGIAVPERYGGGGRGIREAAAVLEEVAASGACMNGASAIHLSIFGMHPVVLHGTEEMRQRFLPAVADGSLHVAFGVTEPDADTDTTRITTRAVRDGDEYVINGRKVWTTKALEADRILLLTRTTPLAECEWPTQGMTLFLVERRSPGVGVTPIDKMGRNAVASCETTYDDVRVPVADRVGDEGRGFQYLLDGLNAERILIAAEAVGIGRAALRSPPTALCRPTAGSATPPSTTWSATSARPACRASPRSARNWCWPTWPSTCSACRAHTDGENPSSAADSAPRSSRSTATMWDR
jgi:acyl-CoA dehydrogenase